MASVYIVKLFKLINIILYLWHFCYWNPGYVVTWGLEDLLGYLFLNFKKYEVFTTAKQPEVNSYHLRG